MEICIGKEPVEHLKAVVPQLSGVNSGLTITEEKIIELNIAIEMI